MGYSAGNIFDYRFKTMPEGPSILLARLSLLPFIGKKIDAVQGNTKIDKKRLVNQRILDIKTWGKHLLIVFDNFTLKIHFMMFGTYQINKRKTTPLRLSIQFKKEEINFYTCSVRFLEGVPDQFYDFSSDVLSDSWNPRKAAIKLKKIPASNVCDALLDQQIFAGVGNIIKNEVLFRIKVHPKSLVGALPAKIRQTMVRESRNYSLDFLKWKKEFTLKKHWLVYTKKTCPRDHSTINKEHIGNTKRRTFFCETCQILYD
jgi:endonuclease-8